MPPKKQPSHSIVQAGGPRPAARQNEYDGLTDDARVERCVERVRDKWGVAVHSFVGIGEELVDACYGGDKRSAMDEGADGNKLFQRIARTLGTLEGGPNRKTLSIARRVAASTGERPLSASHAWKVLPWGHKELLVELADPEKMAEGAKRVLEFGWTLQQTQKWVDEERAKSGRPKAKRGTTISSARRSLARVGQLKDALSQSRIVQGYSALPPSEKKRVRDELDRALSALTALRQRCR